MGGGPLGGRIERRYHRALLGMGGVFLLSYAARACCSVRAVFISTVERPCPVFSAADRKTCACCHPRTADTLANYARVLALDARSPPQLRAKVSPRSLRAVFMARSSAIIVRLLRVRRRNLCPVKDRRRKCAPLDRHPRSRTAGRLTMRRFDINDWMFLIVFFGGVVLPLATVAACAASILARLRAGPPPRAVQSQDRQDARPEGRHKPHRWPPTR